MKAPGMTGLGDGEGENRISAGDGDGTRSILAVAFQAATPAGRKYAKPPETAEMAIASTARTRLRKGLRRLRDARARCLVPNGTQ